MEGKSQVQSFNNLASNYQLISTGNNKYIPTDISTGTSNKGYDNDKLYEELKDLVNPQFRAWYCKKFYQLGVDNVLKLASQARNDGKDPKRLFSHLLRSA